MASKKTQRLYIYLARRDKKGLKILTVLRGKCDPTRLTNLDVLRFPKEWKKQLEDIIYQERMLWEPWAESAGSVKDLKSKLRKRGYKNIPNIIEPMFDLKGILTKMNMPKGQPILDPRIAKNIERNHKRTMLG